MSEISIIICTKNSEATIESCLGSARENEPLEIIVVDGNSTDGTVEIARQYTEKIYSDEGKGEFYARQLGAEKAKGEYIAYIDSDVILPPNTLERMLSELKEKGYTAIHAQILGWKVASYWEWAEDHQLRVGFNKEGETDVIPTTAVIYNKEKLLRYKFDSSLITGGGDLDLCYTWRKDGLKLGISSAHIYHQHRATARSFFRHRILHGKSHAHLFWKYGFKSRALIGIRWLLHPPWFAPYGLFICIKERSLRMLPYYLVLSISTTIGEVAELSKLIFNSLASKLTGKGEGK